MAIIKSFTNLSQSKKLAKILPLESADMYWDYDVQKHEYYPMVMDDQFDDTCIYAWSLAALLGVLPKNLDIGRPVLATNYRGYYWVSYFDEYMKVKFTSKIYDNPIDACVDMIEHLHELKML